MLNITPNIQRDVRLDEDPVVEFINTSKTFDGRHIAVDRLNLAVNKGEFLTILGPSGSGKTTILMMLAGFEDPTEGEILLNGRSLRQTPPFRRNIGVVFQSYALFPHKTVADNVAFPLKRRKLPRSTVTQKVSSMLEIVELNGLEMRRPNQLSGGQQQRVALARALVFEPSLVLMDEPLGSLDRKLREQMQLEIKKLHEACGMTFVYVTHDQDEALTMSDRIAIIDEGRIQQVGTPQEIYECPSNIFVANFIGENNMLSGTIQGLNGSICTVALDTGQVVTAQRMGVDGTGSRTFVCVRPERIFINVHQNGNRNSLTGKVAELIYFGDHTRVCVDVPGHGKIIAKLPHHTNNGHIKLLRGCEVKLHWEDQSCIALQSSIAPAALCAASALEKN